MEEITKEIAKKYLAKINLILSNDNISDYSKIKLTRDIGWACKSEIDDEERKFLASLVN